MRKKIIISATTDLVTDQRVHRAALTLQENGYEVISIGRKLKNSLPLNKRTYQTHRFKLWFEKGALFYASYNIRLFFYLLFHKADILLANDLDTLLPNFLVSKLKRIPLVYDNHEYFTGVPELQHRKLVKSVWKGIEKWIFPKLKYVYTVNDSIKNIFENEYHIPVKVIRNIPLRHTSNTNLSTPEILKNEHRKIIIYQGAINKDRGIEEVIEAMKYIDNTLLLIIGKGDLYESIHHKIQSPPFREKILMTGLIPMEVLRNYTAMATLGLSIEKPTNLNYQYCLPNKLFDYIHANVPILAARLPELEKVINEYQIGEFIDSHTPKHIADKINSILNHTSILEQWKQNLKIASKKLCWENEREILKNIFNSL